MRPAILFVALLAAAAQPPLKTVAAVANSEKPLLPFAVMADLEKRLDDKINTAGGSSPLVLLGQARALYLPGYGAVVTQEISLAPTPYLSPFRQSITPQEVTQTHQQKVDHLPLMKQTARELWASTASTLSMVPNNEQIVIVVRLLYKSWEDTRGLPGQIILKGSRGAGLGGIQTEEQ